MNGMACLQIVTALLVNPIYIYIELIDSMANQEGNVNPAYGTNPQPWVMIEGELPLYLGIYIYIRIMYTHIYISGWSLEETTYKHFLNQRSIYTCIHVCTGVDINTGSVCILHATHLSEETGSMDMDICPNDGLSRRIQVWIIMCIFIVQLWISYSLYSSSGRCPR